MAKLFNRAKMTTSTTGVGTVVLGSASSGFQTFADAGVSDGDVVQYVIEEGTQFEIGAGTYSATGTSLTRNPTESSDVGNGAITLLGQASVSITAIADDFGRLQSDGDTKIEATPTGVVVTGSVTATSFAGDGSALTGIVSIPSGLISIWSGTAATIPSGWALCDGTNGTPDLQNRFVVGAGNSYAVGDTGGASSVTLAEANLPSHTHGAGNYSAPSAGDHTHTGDTSNTGDHSHDGTTSNTGGHSHSGSTSNTGNHSHVYITANNRTGWPDGHADTSNNQGLYWRGGYKNANTSNTGAHSHNFNTNNTGNHSHNFSTSSTGAHSHSFTTASSGAHTHTVDGTSGETGSGSAVTTLPPYYALAYIMKL